MTPWDPHARDLPRKDVRGAASHGDRSSHHVPKAMGGKRSKRKSELCALRYFRLVEAEEHTRWQYAENRSA